MSNTPGVPGGDGHEAEHDTASAILSMAAPSLFPDDGAFVDTFDETVAGETTSRAPERDFPKASWLDALPSGIREATAADSGRISSVNSDDNGLYRMFIDVSP